MKDCTCAHIHEIKMAVDVRGPHVYCSVCDEFLGWYKSGELAHNTIDCIRVLTKRIKDLESPNELD